MMMRIHRWRRRLLLPIAALPMFQVLGGCEPAVQSFTSQLASSIFGQTVAAVHMVLLQSFPSADILQVLLGADRQPFFPG